MSKSLHQTKPDDHIYDELEMYAKLKEKTIMSAKTPSPLSDKVVFDTQGVESPAYQPLPEPCYQSCSATSIAKSTHSNDYYIEKEDAKSIKDEDCKFTPEKTMEQHEEICKEQEPYSKLCHFK